MKRYRNPSDHHDMIECPDGNWVEFSDVDNMTTELLNRLVKSGLITPDIALLHAACIINTLVHPKKESA